MKIEEFIGCTVDELVELKRNSFSRNVVLQHKDITRHSELGLLRTAGTDGEIATYLFVCKNLTIHAIDEKQAPVSFASLSELYGNAVFILQYLKKKKAFALSLFRNLKNESNFYSFFDKTYFSGSNVMKADRNEDAFETFLDFGLLKCAMTLKKDYGIQDLLEVAWQMFNGYRNVKWANNQTSVFCANTPPNSARFIFNVENPELSTRTLYADNELSLFGKTKIIEDKDSVKKISKALEVIKSRYNIITKG